MPDQIQLFTLFDIALKAGAPGLAEPSRQALARNLALKLMHMPCDECERLRKAITNIIDAVDDDDEIAIRAYAKRELVK